MRDRLIKRILKNMGIRCVFVYVCMYVKYREATPPRLGSPKEALLEAPGLRSRHHWVSRVHWALCLGDSLEWLGKVPAGELLCAVPKLTSGA